MLRIFRKRNGSVSVFLTIILVPVIVISCLFVDASRTKLASSVVSSAGDLTLNTVLTQYDGILNDYYGLMASSQTIDEFLSHADEYFQACITSQGVDASEGREMADKISSLLQGESSEIQDLLQIQEDGTKFTVTPVENGTLENPALVKKEIVEFMKYRAPIDGVSEVLQKFRDSAKDLEDAKKNADLVEKKQNFYESESELVKAAKKAYDDLKDYTDLGFTEQTVNDMKQYFNGMEDVYKELHIKTVKDLYNTEGLRQYQKADLYENWTPDASSIKKQQINSYLDNVAKAIRDFIPAAKSLDSFYRNTSAIPNYNKNTVYDIQYWVFCDQSIQANNAYETYITKAKSLCKNMANLKAAVDQLTDAEKAENYTLVNYRDVEISGEKTRAELYEGLNTQFDNLKKTYITNQNSAYNQIITRLSKISKDNAGQIDSSETDQKIREIQQKFEQYYDKCVAAEHFLTQAMRNLKTVKIKADEFQKNFDAWNSAANEYDTDLAKNNREEISELDDEVLKNASPEKVQELIDRLNNIKGLMGSLKKSVNECKYNGTPIKNITSYAVFKQKSGIKKEKISYEKTKLEQYASESFHFQNSDTIGKTGVTDKNSPALDDVNPPDFYVWLKGKFKNYDENEEKQAQDEKDAEKTKYDDDLKDADKANSQGGGEIKDIADRPSAKYAADIKEGLVSNNVSQVSNVVSGLFSNFSSTAGQAAVNLRDDLYFMDYIMNMFSYDTFEKEGKYQLCGSGVNLGNFEGKYSAVDSQWKSEDVKFTGNKTLTNKMINTENNYSYGNEVEYILYGGSNEKNKKSAYGTIFAIRYAMNLTPEFLCNWNEETLDNHARKVAGLSKGIIPAPLFKLVVILGLTGAESARDLQYLKNGMPVELIKDKDSIEITYNEIIPSTQKHVASKSAFFYSDYLKLLLFVKLTTKDEYAFYARTADVIQANMAQKITPEQGFVMNKANVYYSAETSVKIEPLMLDLPLTSSYSEGKITDGVLGRIKYKAYRGY